MGGGQGKQSFGGSKKELGEIQDLFSVWEWEEAGIFVSHWGGGVSYTE